MSIPIALQSKNWYYSTMNTTQLVVYIKSAMRNRSIRQVADEAGISHPALSRLLRGEVKPEPQTLRALAPVLGVSEAVLMQLAGHIEERPRALTDPEVIEVAIEIESLPLGERHQLLQIIRAALGLTQLQSTKSIADEITEGHPVISGDENAARLLSFLKRRDPEIYDEIMRDLIPPP